MGTMIGVSYLNTSDVNVNQDYDYRALFEEVFKYI